MISSTFIPIRRGPVGGFIVGRRLRLIWLMPRGYRRVRAMLAWTIRLAMVTLAALWAVVVVDRAMASPDADAWQVVALVTLAVVTAWTGSGLLGGATEAAFDDGFVRCIEARRQAKGRVPARLQTGLLAALLVAVALPASADCPKDAAYVMLRSLHETANSLVEEYEVDSNAINGAALLGLRIAMLKVIQDLEAARPATEVYNIIRCVDADVPLRSTDEKKLELHRHRT